MTTDGGAWTLAVNSVAASESPTTDMEANTGSGVGPSVGHTRNVSLLAVSRDAEIRHLVESSAFGLRFHAKYTGTYHSTLPAFASWSTMVDHITGSEELLDFTLCGTCATSQFGKPWATAGACVALNGGLPWFYASGICWNSITTNLSNGLSQGPETTIRGGDVLDRYAIFVRELVTPAVCGNGSIETGEDCDDGGESATCDADCTAAQCGDGVTNATAGEECDDGGTEDGDGCSSTCQVESQVPTTSAWGRLSVALLLLLAASAWALKRRGGRV